MKCKECGSWTEVAETRQADNGHTVKRVRRCANNHRFPTYEVLTPIYRKEPKTVRKTVDAAAERERQWKRDMQIVRAVAEGKTHIEVAAIYGIGRQSVTKVMRKHRAFVALRSPPENPETPENP